MAAQDPFQTAKYDDTQIALMEEMCILVDENDVCIGKETKKNCKYNKKWELLICFRDSIVTVIYINSNSDLLQAI